MKKFLLSVAMLCMALGGRAETQEVCQAGLQIMVE